MMKILVIQTASIGDVILATGLLESLHVKFSDASIDLLIKKGNEPLFTDHPFLHEVIVWNKKRDKYLNLLNIIRKVRKNRYDLVVNVQRFFTSGLITVLSGARETRGFRKNPLALFFGRKFAHDIGNGVHEIFRNQALISDIAGNVPEKPKLYTDFAAPLPVTVADGDSSYTISPASLWFTKQYPVEKWVELINLIPADETIYLLGSPADQVLCEEIILRSGHPHVENLAGKLSFLQSAALMKRVSMSFTNDSAPMHLASAVDAPVTVVFCSTIPGFGFGPLSSDSCIVETDLQLNCRPCGLHGYRQCPEKHFNCGYGIGVKKLSDRL